MMPIVAEAIRLTIHMLRGNTAMLLHHCGASVFTLERMQVPFALILEIRPFIHEANGLFFTLHNF